MKTIIINGSPRKNRNTAQLLKAVKEGAESAGAEVLYVDLYDMTFTGCKSCLGCKRKGNDTPFQCIIRDDLAPVLSEICSADHLVIGSPIYFGQPTGEVRSFMERVCFPPLSYNDYSSVFPGKVNVSVILTMNQPLEMYNNGYQAAMESYFGPFHFLKGKLEILPVCDTLQVDDYSKYEMAGFSEEHKKAVHENEFPEALEKAFQIGKSLASEDL